MIIVTEELILQHDFKLQQQKARNLYQSAHSRCAAEMQSISDSNATATLTEVRSL